MIHPRQVETADETHRCIHAIGWSLVETARRLGVSVSLVRSWVGGWIVTPAPVLAYLRACRAALDDVPAPQKTAPGQWKDCNLQVDNHNFLV